MQCRSSSRLDVRPGAPVSSRKLPDGPAQLHRWSVTVTESNSSALITNSLHYIFKGNRSEVGLFNTDAKIPLIDLVPVNNFPSFVINREGLSHPPSVKMAMDICTTASKGCIMNRDVAKNHAI